jgi:hypothetical protein
VENVVLFIAPDAATNEAAQKALARLGVAVDVVSPTEFLEGRVLLPFIETLNGSRYYGLSSIERYVNRKLRTDGNGGGENTVRTAGAP